MGKLLLGVLAGLASAVSAVPAQAGVLYFNKGGANVVTKIPSSPITIANFDGIDTGTFSGTAGIASTSLPTPAQIRRPQYESTGNFAYVVGNGSYSVTFAAAQVFTFILGSLDSTNSLTLNFADNSTKTFTGAELVGLTAGSATPDRAGRVTYDAQGIAGGAILGAVFRSGANQAFEFDSITTAAPEPATWLSMILGFGLIGGALRRVRPSRKLALA